MKNCGSAVEIDFLEAYLAYLDEAIFEGRRDEALDLIDEMESALAKLKERLR